MVCQEMAKYASSYDDLTSSESDREEIVKNDDWWTDECQEATKAMKKVLRQLKRNKHSESLRHKYKKLKKVRQRVLRNAFEKWYVQF